jgi:hypothetical protein
MVDAATVRRIARSLPELTDDSDEKSLGFGVAGKGLAWSWKERVNPKTARVPHLGVLAVRCPKEWKEAILDADPQIFFTEPHYNGFPAVLVRLAMVDETQIEALLKMGWRCVAPKAMLKAHPNL